MAKTRHQITRTLLRKQEEVPILMHQIGPTIPVSISQLNQTSDLFRCSQARLLVASLKIVREAIQGLVIVIILLAKTRSL